MSPMLPTVLGERAVNEPNGVCIIEAESDQTVTYAALDAEVRQLAAGIRTLGVRPSDTVATMLPHCIDTYRIWFALARLGALEVPIGRRYRGHMLTHILEDSGAAVLVVDHQYLEEVIQLRDDGDLTHLEHIVVRGETDRENVLRLVDLQDVSSDGDNLREPAAHDLALVLYTSGTTGPAKGVLVPWGQVDATVAGVFPEGTLRGGKVLYGPFPSNHIGGRLFPGMGIMYGVPAVIRDAFSASAYWSDVERFQCTSTALVSAMAAILAAAPVTPNDENNTLEDVLMNPVQADFKNFQHRFGVRICTDFNMTETSIPLHSGWQIDDWRSCGRVRPGPPGYQLRVVDEHDRPVPTGKVGELICRTDEPWTLTVGYFGRPTETAAAWRNGWFHTGDAFRVDEQGRYYFVDRLKDAIRRRGENISSFEVERELLDHPDVIDCAAIGVPSELGEEDIKVFVVARPGSRLTESVLIEYVRARAADFMVPRFVEFLNELPRTEATQKVKKAELRARATPLD